MYIDIFSTENLFYYCLNIIYLRRLETHSFQQLCHMRLIHYCGHYQQLHI
jgi:hypothetical protein